MPLEITLGNGVKNPQGQTCALNGNPVDDLALILRTQPQTEEGWWSQHVWRDARRSRETWLAASGIGIDLDFYDAQGNHALLPPDAAAILTEAARANRIPGNLFHLTPRGARVVFVFPDMVDDPGKLTAAATAAGQRVQRAIATLVPGLRVDDSILCDLARLLFRPAAVVKGEPRTAEVLVLDHDPVAPESLNGAPPEPQWTVLQHPASTPIAAAIERYNAEHAEPFPPGRRGTCPICLHNDCFGQMRDDPTRWSCFSTNHPPGIGVKGAGCWHGDQLEIDAYLYNRKPVEHLRAIGLLPSKAGPPPAEPATVTRLTPHAASQRDKTKSYATACALLRDPMARQHIWEPGDLRFNEMTLMPELAGTPVTEERLGRLRELCEEQLTTRQGKPIEFAKETLQDALLQVAKENAYNPVLNYLNSLTWDGEPRISYIADDVLHVEPTPLVQAMIRKWMISAVARVLRPGCKVDTVLILVGDQGLKKSTFFDTLAGEGWFRDSMMEVGSKDAYMLLRGVWIFEWSELEALWRARSSGTLKAFLSSRFDSFRAPYARDVRDHPRQCVIVGTANDRRFLSDPTGNRRYWTVEVKYDINVTGLRGMREQLWAEAVAAFKSGETWWFEPSDEAALRIAQEEYVVRDVWEDVIVGYADAMEANRELVTTLGLLSRLDMPLHQQDPRSTTRVNAIMERHGWEPYRARLPDGSRPHGWRRKPTVTF